jgi:hypothetical protein
MLLSWITATVPVSPRIACSEVDGCAARASDKNEAAVVDDDWVYGPKLTHYQTPPWPARVLASYLARASSRV